MQRPSFVLITEGAQMSMNNGSFGIYDCAERAAIDGCIRRNTGLQNENETAKALWGRFGLALKLTGAEFASVMNGGETAQSLIRRKIERGEFTLDGESYFPATGTHQPDEWPVKEDIVFEF